MVPALASLEGRILPAHEAVLPWTDLAVTVGWSVFETAEVVDGRVRRLDAHLDRLAASASEALIPMPERAVLAEEVVALAAAGAGLGRLRITLSGSGRRVVVLQPLDPSRRGQPITAVRGPHVDEPFLGGGVKHASRAPWVVAVRRSGADEVLLVDAHGRFTEGTTCGIVAVVDGVLHTAPHDGRILASTTVEALLEAAQAEGVAVRREGPTAVGPWDGLYVASATRGLAPVAVLDGAALPGWEPVGRRLAAALQG